MRVKVIKEFIDRENDMTHRKIGETFEADEPRAEQLSQLGFVEKPERNREKRLIIQPQKQQKKQSKHFCS